MAILGDATVFQFMCFSSARAEIFGVTYPGNKTSNNQGSGNASPSTKFLPFQHLATFNLREAEEGSKKQAIATWSLVGQLDKGVKRC